MVYEREKEHDKDKREENCRIEIKDSIVILICGDVDVDKLRECLGTVVGVKGKKTGYSPVE